LAQSIGIEDSSALSVIDNVPLPGEPHYARPTTPDITRPELVRLDHVVAAAENAAALSSAAYFPTLSAFGGYSVGMPNKDMFGKTWNDYFSAGLSLNWDFNFGGKTSRSVAMARQAASSARMTRAKLQDDLLLQSTVAHNNLTLAYNNCRTAADEFDIAQRKFNLARQKQQAGNLSLNRLLEQEADLTATEQQYRAAVVRYYLAETEYLYAIGSIRLYGGLQ
jgi:outer membrane protein TolC